MNRYLAAVLLSAAAVALSLAIGTKMQPFVLLLCAATAGSAFYGGFRAGLLSVMLGTFAAAYLLFEPTYSLGVERREDVIMLITYVATSLVICLVSGNYYASRLKLAAHAADQKRLLERAEEWRVRYEAAIKASRSVLYDSDYRTDQVVYAGDIENILGYTAAELKGDIDKWVALIHPHDRAVFHEEFKRSQRDHTSYHADYRMTRKDGRLVWIRDEGHFADENGGSPPVRMIGLVRDITDQRLAEDRLRAGEERLRLFIENTPVAVAMFDREMRYLAVSHRWRQDYGLGDVELLGRSHYEIFPRLRESWREAHRRALQGEVVRQEEDRFEREDGTTSWVRWEVRPWHDANGEIGGVILYTEDVTERLRAVERFQLAADALNGVIYECDFVTGEVIRSKGLEVVLGYRPDQVPHTLDWWIRQVHPDDLPKIFPRYKAFEADESSTIEYRVRHKDGRWVDVEDRAVSVFNDRGLAIKRIGCTLDVTHRKTAEKVIENGRRMLQALVEECPFGIYVIDAEFRVMSANKGSQTGAFVNVRPLVGRPFDEVVQGMWPEPLAADLIGIFRKTLDTGESYLSRDFESPRIDVDRTEAYEWELHRILLPDGRYGVACYYYDATRLRRVQLQLKEADRKKDEFLAVLAHELRNPLAPISNGLQIIKLAGGDSGMIENCRIMMERQVEQLTRLIDDLMDLSRISRGTIELRKTRMPLSEALRDAVDASRHLIEAQGHQLVVDVPAEPIYVDGDHARLAQVFSNLLNNSAKYTQRGGRIGLAVERQGSDVAVSVQDNGVGIPSDMLNRVFEMFARIDRPSEKHHDGLGIGLNICRRLVVLHGGTITAESGGLGMGSRFTVRLPIAPSVDVRRGTECPEATARPALRHRILIVDDNRDAALSLATMLRMMGNDTLSTHDGAEALSAAEKFLPDLILLDLGMTAPDGYEVCRRIRERPWGRHIKIAACTGWGQEDKRREAKEAGFDLHLVKPVEPQALEEVLASLKSAPAY